MMSTTVLGKTEEIIVDTIDYNSDDAIEDENLRMSLDDTGEDQQMYTSENQSTTATTSSSRNRNGHIVSVTHLVTSNKSGTKNLMENEKRIRREIANSNERRRMQSINAGFQSLRSLLPHHEGEKLSKAAILQQTAQYIIELEREKTHLLSQNSQLKRLLGQHEIGSVGGGGGGGGNDDNVTPGGAIKKRKFTDTIMTVQTISDSSDEGLGSMSPEPVTLLNNVTGVTKTNTTGVAYLNVNVKEWNELKTRLEAERSRRASLEERLRQLERQIYPTHQYVHREVIEHTDNIREEDMSSMSFTPLQVVEIDSLPSDQGQVVLCHTLENPLQVEEEVISGDLIANIREEVVIGDTSREYVELPSRLQPILEAAIKAEPKVEVERINPTITKFKTENDIKPKDINGKQAGKKMYITNRSRQNLETIVEAIRHLEGDHLFENGEETIETKTPIRMTVQKKIISQEAPLALTTASVKQGKTIAQTRKLPVGLTPFLQLKKQPNGVGNTVTIIGSGNTVATTVAKNISNSNSSNNSSNNSHVMGTNSNNINTSNIITLKTQQSSPLTTSSNSVTETTSTLPPHIRITGVANLKQCRPGVIVAKQVS